MYEYDANGNIIGIAGSVQDFGQQATGAGAILQDFNIRQLYQTPTNQAGPMGMINTNPVGTVFGDNPFANNPYTAPTGGGGGSRDPYNLSTIPMQSIRSLSVENTMQGPIGGGVEYNPPPPTTPTGGGGGSGIDFAGNIKSNMSAANIGNIASGVGGIIQGLVGRPGRRNAQINAQEEYDKMRQQYLDLDTSNLYAGVTNKYRDMENAYEDLTVNQQQAQFERQMFEQQQANIMQDLAGSAGSSGIAGLAQALSNQAMVQSQKAAGSIGLQESRNQIFKAREASKIQFAERGGEAQAEAMRLAGAETARGLEYQKTGTLFGMAQQDLAGANAAVAAGDAALYGGIGQIAGTVLTAGIGAI